MPQPHAPASSKPPKQRWLGGVGCALTFVFGVPAILLLLCLSGWLYFVYQAAGYRQQLAVQEQRVRDAGEPLDGAELNDWYRIPEGDEDLTPLYLSILESLKPEKPPDKTGLPYVDASGDTIPFPGETWDDIARAEEYLAHFEPTFSLLEQTLQRTGRVRYPVDHREGLTMRLPHVQDLRELMRVCLLRAAVLCHRGDYAGATDAIIATIRAAETIQAEPGLVVQLVRVAIHSAVDHAVAFVLTDENFPSEQIERIRDELIPIDRDSASHVAMLGERAGFIYQSMYGTLDELQAEDGSNQKSIGGITDRPMRELRPGDCALTLELTTDAVDASSGNYPDIWPKQQKVAANIDAVLKGDRDKLPWNMNILAALLLPAGDAAFTAYARGAGQHRCTIVLLAAEQYRRERGDYPQQLDDLVPFYLATLPQDPYTGEPLRMRHDPGQRFIIYAVGKNGVDDGGEIDQNVDGQPLDTGVAVPPLRAAAE